MFLLEDEFHAEPQGEFSDFESALAEVKRRASIPWDHEPNRAAVGVVWLEFGGTRETG